MLTEIDRRDGVTLQVKTRRGLRVIDGGRR